MSDASADGNGELLLSAPDLRMFDYFRISRWLLAEAGVRRVTDREAREKYDIDWWDTTCNLAGVLYGYFDPGTGQRVSCRLRPDNPPVNSEGKLVKYLSPPYHKARRHCYFAPGSERYVADPTVQVVLVESEKSTLAITSAAERAGRALLAIGIGGCNGWQGRIGNRLEPDGTGAYENGPLPDFQLVHWQKRDVVIMFDSDSKTNFNVRNARRKLAAFLTVQGAVVRIANLGLLVQPDSGSIQ
jgi:hypothetical protein